MACTGKLTKLNTHALAGPAYACGSADEIQACGFVRRAGPISPVRLSLNVTYERSDVPALGELRWP